MSIVVWDSASESVDDLLDKTPQSLEVDLVEDLSEVSAVVEQCEHCCVFLDHDSAAKKVEKEIKKIRKLNPDASIFIICNNMPTKKMLKHQDSKVAADGYLKTPLDERFLNALFEKFLEEDIPPLPPAAKKAPARARSFESVGEGPPAQDEVPAEVKKMMEPYGLTDEGTPNKDLGNKIQASFNEVYEDSDTGDNLDLGGSDDLSLDDDDGLDLGADDAGDLDLGGSDDLSLDGGDDGGLDLGTDDARDLDLGSSDDLSLDGDDDGGLDLGAEDARDLDAEPVVNINDEMNSASEQMSAEDQAVFQQVLSQHGLDIDFDPNSLEVGAKIQSVFNYIFDQSASDGQQAGESTMSDDEIKLNDGLDLDLGERDLELGDASDDSGGDLDLGADDGGLDLDIGDAGDPELGDGSDDSGGDLDLAADDGGLDLDMGDAGDLELGGADDGGDLDLGADDGGDLDLGSDDAGLDLGADDGGDLDLSADDPDAIGGADDLDLGGGGDLDLSADDPDSIGGAEDLDLGGGGDLDLSADDPDAIGGADDLDLTGGETEEPAAEEYELDETGRDNRPITGAGEDHIDNAMAEIEAMMADEPSGVATMDATGDDNVPDDLSGGDDDILSVAAEDPDAIGGDDLDLTGGPTDDDLEFSTPDPAAFDDVAGEFDPLADMDEDPLAEDLDFSNAPSDDDLEDITAALEEMDATTVMSADDIGSADDLASLGIQQEEEAESSFTEAPFSRPGQDKTSTHVRNQRAEIEAMMSDEGGDASDNGPQDVTDVNIKAPASSMSRDELISQADMVGFHNEELAKLAATIKNLREDREQLLQKIDDLENKKETEKRANIAVKAELDEKKIELSLIKKRFNKQAEEAEYRAQLAEEKKRIMEEKNKTFKQELDRLNRKVRVDIKKIQARETELENQLEMLRSDSEIQIRNRDQRILELKRKIDALEFDLDSIAEQEKQSKEENMEVEEKMEMVMKTLRSAITILEGDERAYQSFEFLKKKNNLDI